MLTQKIKTELAKLGIAPKKSLGQNFLINEGIYKKIIGTLELKSGDTVVEVGPGLGTLTELLAVSRANIIAIEKDRLLADYLKNKFTNSKNVRIIEDDILKFNPETCNPRPTADTVSGLGLKPATYKVVGNIPFYLTSHLLRIIFEKWPQPELIILMLQKEVAQRICAKSPKMSLLAVSVQYYAKPKIISYVSHGSFYPAPEVDSAIIKLAPSDWRLTTRAETTNFFKIVRAGFAGKRKQLGNNLAGGLKLTKNFVEEKLKSAGINPARRAETLTLDEWQRVTNIFSLRD